MGSSGSPFGRRRGPEYWAFRLHRLSGVVLSLYLAVHLGFLTLLALGPESYDRFVAVVRAPAFVTLDVALAASAIFHAFNGLRVSLIGLGWGVKARRPLLLAAVLIGLALLGWLGTLMFAPAVG